MFRSAVAHGALSAAQQRASDARERFNLIEQETAGCHICKDPVLRTTNGYTGQLLYLEIGAGWGVDAFSNGNGRRELKAFQRRGGPWRPHECRGVA